MAKYTVYQEDGKTVVEANVPMTRVDQLLDGDLDTDEIEWAIEEYGRCDCPNGYVIVEDTDPAPGPFKDDASQGPA